MNPLLLRRLLINRRHFFGRLGIGAAALSALSDASLAATPTAPSPVGLQGLPHFAASAKRVIYLFQSGAPSQHDLFDYKPQLADSFGDDLPDSIRQGQRLTGMTATQERFPIAPTRFKFAQHGQSGAWLSELLPHTARVADDLCFIKSMYTEAINHDPAITFFQTGAQLAGRPSIGSWLSYGLGSENQDLPAFVALLSNGSGNPMDQPLYDRLWGSGFLPTNHQGIKFRSGGDPVLFLSNPAGIDATDRRRMLDDLAKLNEMQLAEQGDPEISTRISQYELAYRMQTSVPELMDISKEPNHTVELYGPEARTPGTYASNCLLARRLAERGVRFIQLFHRGWDQHAKLPTQLAGQCRDTDQPSAGLIQDLKQRDLLKDTLVIWGGEFGRTVYCQGRLTAADYGRDHHPRCFSMWLAGGGIRPGMTFGETDDYGYNIVRNPVHVHDLHATLLHCLGIDHTKLTFKFQGVTLFERLSTEHCNLVKAFEGRSGHEQLTILSFNLLADRISIGLKITVFLSAAHPPEGSRPLFALSCEKSRNVETAFLSSMVGARHVSPGQRFSKRWKMFRFGKKGQDSRRNDVRRVLVEHLESRKLMAADAMPSIMGSSYFGSSVSWNDSAEVAESFTVDFNNLPKGSFGGVAIARSSNAFGEAPMSFELDLNNLPEGTVAGEAVLLGETVSGEVSFASAVDLNSILRNSATEQGESYVVDMNNLPEGTVIGDAIPVSELGESYVVDMNNLPEGTVIGDAIPVSELGESYVVDLNNLPEGTVIGDAIPVSELGESYVVDLDNLPEGTVIGDAIPVSELGESYVVDMNNLPEGTVIGDAIPVSELGESYVVDLNNLPEGTVIGDAIPVSELGESYAVDMNNLPEGTVIGDAIPVSELGESYEVDLNNLPEGTVIGEAVVVGDSVSGDASFEPAVDLNSILRNSANEQGESYVVDMNNLPEGTVIGEAIPVSELGESFTVDFDNLPEGSVGGPTVTPAPAVGNANPGKPSDKLPEGNVADKPGTPSKDSKPVDTKDSRVSGAKVDSVTTATGKSASVNQAPGSQAFKRGRSAGFGRAVLVDAAFGDLMDA